MGKNLRVRAEEEKRQAQGRLSLTTVSFAQVVETMLEWLELPHGTNCVSIDGCLPSEAEVCSDCSRGERQTVSRSSLICLRQVFTIVAVSDEDRT